MYDQLNRFLFEDFAVRGEFITLSNSYQNTIAKHNYPKHIQLLMGQALAALGLMTATLKIKGSISLQLQTKGEIQLLIVQSDEQLRMRGVAQLRSEKELPFAELVKDGHMVITIEPENGKRYQGIVPLSGDSLESCLIEYFNQSEQLSTHISLFADDSKAAGFMLQQLPSETLNPNDWQHLQTLAETIKDDEALTLDASQLLHRLYHEEKVRLFDPQGVCFQCRCSQQRCEESLATLDEQELLTMVREDDGIHMSCEFCLSEYRFDENDIKRIKSGFPSQEGHS